MQQDFPLTAVLADPFTCGKNVCNCFTLQAYFISIAFPVSHVEHHTQQPLQWWTVSIVDDGEGKSLACIDTPAVPRDSRSE